MPKAIHVTPKKWSNIKILFDDGIYSVIFGKFENTPDKMGKRWNDNYPRQGSSATWYVEYDKFVPSTIQALIQDYEANQSRTPLEDQYLNNCREIINKI